MIPSQGTFGRMSCSEEGWMLWAATPSDPTVSLLKVPLGFYDMML